MFCWPHVAHGSYSGLEEDRTLWASAGGCPCLALPELWPSGSALAILGCGRAGGLTLAPPHPASGGSRAVTRPPFMEAGRNNPIGSAGGGPGRAEDTPPSPPDESAPTKPAGVAVIPPKMSQLHSLCEKGWGRGAFLHILIIFPAA